MRNELEVQKLEAGGPVLATVTVTTAIVPVIGPYVGEMGSCVSAVDFCVRYSPQNCQFQTGKAFPACYKGLSSTEEVVLTF